jgi:hypothetical protein
MLAIAVCALGLAAGGLVAANASADNPLAGEWHMDSIGSAGEGISSTPDSSGNGNDLTGNLSGNVLIPGRWGNAIEFNALNFDQLGTNSAALQPPQLTVMAWVQGEPGPGADRYIVAQGGSPACAASSYALYTGGNGGLQFYISDGTDPAVLSPDAGPGIWDGRWHAVAGTYDGSTVRLYVDGNEVGSGTPTNAAIDYQLPTTQFSVGDYPDPNCHAGNFFYSGGLDELRVYNRALTAAEINQLQTANGPTPPELGGSTTTTTTTTTTTPPPTRAVAKFVITGPSATLKGAAWFNGATSIASGGARIISYAWDPTGSGNYSDPCGSAPIASLVFANRGEHTVGLQVTDSAGAVSTYRQTVLVTASMVNRAISARNTFDCENPAGGGDEPSTADCIKTFAWSILDVNSRGGTDDCFKITSKIRPGAGRVIIPMGAARDGGARARAAGILNALYVYHASVTGPVAINGLYVPVPHAVASVYDTNDGTVGLGSVALRIGPFGTQTLNLSFHLSLQNLPVSDCYSHPTQGFRLLDSGSVKKDTTIEGLPVQGGIGVDLLYHSSRVTLNLGLPNIFGFAPGQPAQGTVCLNLDNTNGLSLDGLKIGPIPNAFIGPIALQNLTFHYVSDDNLWEGGATVTFPGSPVSIDASPPPPDLGFGIKDGHFDHAGIGLDFGPGAQPQVFPNVFLTNIHVALGTDPLRFTGGVALKAAQLVDINGDVFIAFASPDQPYAFPTTGGDLAFLSGRTISSFTIAVGGTAAVHVPFIDQVPLANAYLLYEFPDYFEFGGGFSYEPPELSITGNVGGFVDPSVGAFDLHGQIQACLKDEIEIDVGFIHQKLHLCLGAGGDVSSKGAGICAPVPIGPITLDVTLGYVWGSGPDVNIGSCDFSAFQVAHTHAGDTRAHAAQVGGVDLQKGVVATLRVTGSGAPPDALITEPNGTTFSTAAPPSDAVVMRVPGLDETLIALPNPSGGRWSVSGVPGSAPITSVASSHALPAPDVRVRVDGRGQRRVLSYEVTPAPGRVVTFVEHGRGVYRVLGRADGRRGRISFVPAPGPAGRREVLALISNGATVSQSVVGSFVALAPGPLPAPRGLRVVRVGSRLAVSWGGVLGSWRYATILTGANGRRELLLSRGRRVTFTGVDPAFGGRVQVVALGASGLRGRAATVSFRALRARRPGR